MWASLLGSFYSALLMTRICHWHEQRHRIIIADSSQSGTDWLSCLQHFSTVQNKRSSGTRAVWPENEGNKKCMKYLSDISKRQPDVCGRLLSWRMLWDAWLQYIMSLIFVFKKMSSIPDVFGLQLWNLAVLLILTCSFSWWGSFLWLMKFNLC